MSAGVMGMDKFSEEVRRGVDEIREVSTQLAQIIHQVQTLTPRFATVSEGMHARPPARCRSVKPSRSSAKRRINRRFATPVQSGHRAVERSRARSRPASPGSSWRPNDLSPPPPHRTAWQRGGLRGEGEELRPCCSCCSISVLNVTRWMPSGWWKSSLLALKRFLSAARRGGHVHLSRPARARAGSLRTHPGRPAVEHLSTRIIIVNHSSPGGEEQLLGLIAERATEIPCAARNGGLRGCWRARGRRAVSRPMLTDATASFNSSAGKLVQESLRAQLFLPHRRRRIMRTIEALLRQEIGLTLPPSGLSLIERTIRLRMKHHGLKDEAGLSADAPRLARGTERTHRGGRGD